MMALKNLTLLIAATAITGLAGCVSRPIESERASHLVSAGEGLAVRNCRECHAMGPTGPSALADAPPFRVLRLRYSSAEMGRLLRERMVEIHPRMPVLAMDAGELGTFLDYWERIEPAPR